MAIVIDPELAPPSGVTLENLVARVRRELGDRDQINKLADEVGPDETSLSFVWPLEGVTRGTLLNLNDEVCHVWATDVSNKTVTVERGYNTTIQDTHGVNTIVYNGVRSQKQIIDAINDQLMHLSAEGLFQMKSSTFETSTSLFAHALEGIDTKAIYDVQYLDWGSASTWLRVPSWSYNGSDQTVQFWPPTGNVRVLYKTGFSKLTDPGDDVQTVSGLHPEANDILIWGACEALTTGEEYKRNDFRTQGDTRRPDEVPYRAMALARRDFKDRRDSLLATERNRLNKTFPYRKVGF